MLSMPDDWTSTSEALAEEAPEGRDAVRTALKELETHGYFTRVRVQDERGQWRTDVIVHELPTTGNPSSARAATTRKRAAQADDGIPVVGQPVANKKTLSKKTQEEQTRALEASDAPSSPPQLSLVAEDGDRVSDVVADEFEDWWSAYAGGKRKIRKRQALSAWRQAVKRLGGWRKAEPMLVEGTTRWNEHWRRSGTLPQHIPHPTTWLNGEDYLATPVAGEERRAR
jgi:hypothetical protein